MEERTQSAVPRGAAAPHPERWRVSGAGPARRLQSWSEILADTHLAFDVADTPATPGRFDGIVTRRRFADLVLVDCAASPFFGHRSRALMGGAGESRQPEDILGFQFVYRGVEKVKEGDRELALTAGDVVLWDGLQPTDVEIVEAFHKRTLLFPRDRVLALCPRLGEVSAFPSLNDSGPARLLVRYMNALAAEFPGSIPRRRPPPPAPRSSCCAPRSSLRFRPAGR